MICFPLDNTKYIAAGLGAWCGTRTRGVFSADDHYTVTVSTGMGVLISPGLGWIKITEYWGACVLSEEPIELIIDTAHASLPRIDTICIRHDKNLNSTDLIIKKGVPNINPSIPAIQRDFDYEEIYVATVYVNPGVTQITAQNITDQRLNENYCGLMRDGVTRIPTQQLYDQWSDVILDFKNQMQSAFEDYVSQSEVYQDNMQHSFDDWFANLHYVLDGDVAGHLQDQIDSHVNSKAVSNSGVHGIKCTQSNNGNRTATDLAFNDSGEWKSLHVGRVPASIVIGAVNGGYTSSECDYLCTGVDDQNTINTAISRLLGGGEVKLLDGLYNLSGSIVIDKPNITISGCGNSTTLKATVTEINMIHIVDKLGISTIQKLQMDLDVFIGRCIRIYNTPSSDDPLEPAAKIRFKISNNTFNNISSCGICIESHFEAHGSEISDNKFYGDNSEASTAIYVSDGQDVNIENNFINGFNIGVNIFSEYFRWQNKRINLNLNVFSNIEDSAISCSDLSDGKICNNIIGTAKNGISLFSQNNRLLINENHITADTCIKIINGISSNILNNNLLGGLGSIELTSNCTDNLIALNHCNKKAIIKAGTGNEYYGNKES